MTLRLLSPLAILAVVAGCGGGGKPPPGSRVPPPSTAFEHWDRDRDDSIGRQEWERQGDRVFIRLDVDGSGEISKGEVQAGYDVFDIDGDGALGPDEVRSDYLDRDGDGVITRPEWRNAELGQSFDENGDGRVSRGEFRRQRTRNFDRLDDDRNGRLSRGELADSALGGALFRF